MSSFRPSQVERQKPGKLLRLDVESNNPKPYTLNLIAYKGREIRAQMREMSRPERLMPPFGLSREDHMHENVARVGFYL